MQMYRDLRHRRPQTAKQKERETKKNRRKGAVHKVWAGSTLKSARKTLTKNACGRPARFEDASRSTERTLRSLTKVGRGRT